MSDPRPASTVLIIVPAFNESATIGDVIGSIAGAGPLWDILVVNDGSRDGTEKIVAEDGRAMVIDLCSNLGIGGAMQAGFRFAVEHRYDVAVQVDGDGQHEASGIRTLLDECFRKNADVVIGSRFHGSGAAASFRSTPVRRAGIGILRVLCGLLTGYRVSDVTSGFRVYNRRALALVARRYPADFPEPESLVLFHRERLSVCEAPITMNPRRFGSSSISGAASIYYMVKVIIALVVDSLQSKRS